MKAFYFPFTYLSEPEARALYRRFGRFGVYQSIAGQVPELVENLSAFGLIDLRYPVSGNENQLMKMYRSYIQWGSEHRKELASLTQLAAPGFYNESFVTDLRNQVLRGGEDPAPDPDPVSAARLFLQFAQAYDIEEAEIAHHLASTDRATKQLFEELRGEGLMSADEQESSVPGEDTGAFMTEARISAWSLLLRNDAAAPGIFLTRGSAIMELISDQYPLAHVDTLSCVPGEHSESGLMTEVLDPYVEAGEFDLEEIRKSLRALENKGSDEFVVQIYLLQGCDSSDFAGGLMENFCRMKPEREIIRNIFICCLQVRQ